MVNQVILKHESLNKVSLVVCQGHQAGQQQGFHPQSFALLSCPVSFTHNSHVGETTQRSSCESGLLSMAISIPTIFLANGTIIYYLLWLNKACLCVYSTFFLAIYLDGHPAFLRVLALVKSSTVSIDVQACYCAITLIPPC